MSDFKTDFAVLKKPFLGPLILTSAFAAGVSISAVMLLGMSGWFLTAAAVAGAGGPIVAQGFNYLLPSAAIRFFAIARTVLRYGERYLGHSVALRAMSRLRPALFQRLLGTPTAQILGLSRGKASARFIQDVSLLENALVAKSAPASAIAGVVTALILATWGNIWAGLVLAVFMMLALVCSLYIHRSAPKAEGLTEGQEIGALKTRFFELLTLLPDIRAYDLAKPAISELEQLEDSLRKTIIGKTSAEATTLAANLVITSVCLPVIGWFCLSDSLADLALALLATSMGLESLGILTKTLGQKREFDDAQLRIAELYDPAIETPQDGSANAACIHLSGQTVDFRKNVRLRIEGASGSGKTRLIEVLMGLRPVSDIPGLKLEGVSRDLFALCPQDAAVITGTIRDNLLMAFDDSLLKHAPVSDIETLMDTALSDACLNARIATLAKGLDTWIGDGGIGLSGGEKKRLALARAYLRQAPILVLDEPTEGLDLSTEAQIIDNLNQRLIINDQSLILVSHRDAPRVLTHQLIHL